MAFEMKWYQSLVNMKWQLKVTNRKIRRRVNARKAIVDVLIEENEPVWTCMKDGQQQDDKESDAGTMAGANRRRRPRREWLDDIVEWAGADLGSLRWADQG